LWKAFGRRGHYIFPKAEKERKEGVGGSKKIQTLKTRAAEEVEKGGGIVRMKESVTRGSQERTEKLDESQQKKALKGTSTIKSAGKKMGDKSRVNDKVRSGTRDRAA